MNIDEKLTYYTPYKSTSKQTLQGNSLQIRGAKIDVSTAKGEVIESILTDFVGTKVGSGLKIGYEFSFSIPIMDTPLAISPTASYEINVQVTESSNNLYSFHLVNGVNSKYCTKARVTWAENKLRLTKKTDYFRA